jgi:hypothetical protein
VGGGWRRLASREERLPKIKSWPCVNPKHGHADERASGPSSPLDDAMPLARLYEQHADECVRSAGTAEDPKRRALLLKIADDWRRDAQRLRQEATAPGKPARQS